MQDFYEKTKERNAFEFCWIYVTADPNENFPSFTSLILRRVNYIIVWFDMAFIFELL